MHQPASRHASGFLNVTKFWKMDQNYTFIFSYISCCHINSTILYSLTYFIFLFGIHTLNSQDYARNTLKINTHTQKYVSLHKPRNTLDYMCDVDPFSKIQSHFFCADVSMCVHPRRPKLLITSGVI